MERGNPSEAHLELFPYHHDYYAHLLLKEEERYQRCNYKARSPQVSILLIHNLLSQGLKVSLFWNDNVLFMISMWLTHLLVAVSQGHTQRTESAQQQTKPEPHNLPLGSAPAGYLYGSWVWEVLPFKTSLNLVYSWPCRSWNWCTATDAGCFFLPSCFRYCDNSWPSWSINFSNTESAFSQICWCWCQCS